MGRGDKKTAKGKRAMGSYGNTRKKKSSTPVIKPAAKKETVKKAEAPAEKKPAAKKAAAPKAAAEKKPAAKKTTKKAEK
jgi:ribosomal small subunit protein bTHX